MKSSFGAGDNAFEFGLKFSEKPESSTDDAPIQSPMRILRKISQKGQVTLRGNRLQAEQPRSNGFKIIAAQKMIIKSDVLIQIGSNTLVFLVHDILIHGSPKILAFDPDLPSPQEREGAPSGDVYIVVTGKVDADDGAHLIVDLRGEPGPKGRDGQPGDPGKDQPQVPRAQRAPAKLRTVNDLLKEKSGKVEADKLKAFLDGDGKTCKTSDCFVWECSDPTVDVGLDGQPGDNGKIGEPGQPGGSGGKGGRLFVFASEADTHERLRLLLQFEDKEGAKGGAGGRGGHGGIGGKGEPGRPADKEGLCPGGRDGAYGMTPEKANDAGKGAAGTLPTWPLNKTTDALNGL